MRIYIPNELLRGSTPPECTELIGVTNMVARDHPRQSKSLHRTRIFTRLGTTANHNSYPSKDVVRTINSSRERRMGYRSFFRHRRLLQRWEILQ